MIKFKSLIVLILPFILTGCNFPFWQVKVSQLQVFASPRAEVFIDGKSHNMTPLITNDFKSGKHQIKVATGSASWVGNINLTPGTITIINRHLIVEEGEGQTGEVLELSKGKGIVVISQPEDSQVEIDGKIIGKTPLALNDVSPGDHQIAVFKEGYLKRAVQVQVHTDFQTTLSVELAKEKSKDATPSAQVSQNIVEILQTPTGWLRVRSQPSLSASEIAKVNTGEKHTLLQEQQGWYKIRLPDNREGWISAQYAQK